MNFPESEIYYAKLNSKEYFCGEKKICREERQYALFLYNCFLKYQCGDTSCEDVVFNCLGLSNKDNIVDFKINNVFYEFTALRDIFDSFNKNISKKIEFNKDLCKENGINDGDEALMLLQNRKLLEYNLARIPMNIFDEINNIDQALALYRVRCMMNSKPDIVVLYTVKEKKYAEKKYAVALECKFESSVGKYDRLYKLIGNKSNSDDKKLILSQTDIQRQILDYLFGDDVNKDVVVVKFDVNSTKSNTRGKLVHVLISEIVPQLV